MKNSELIKHIESKYDVKSIQYKGLNVWLELRNRVFAKISLKEESLLKISSQTYKAVLLTTFYGFFNWFRAYDAWFFSAKISRFEIEGKYYDRFFDYPASQIKKSLFIELTTDALFPRKKVASKYIVSKSPLILLEKLIGVFIKVKKANLTVFNQINTDYNLDMNPDYAIKKMVAQYRVMKLLLRFKRPKVVFFAPSYTSYGYIKALKEKGVKVVEIQHGVVLKEHFGYYVHADFDRSYFVDHFLTFGRNEKAILDGENKGILPSSVRPIGIFFLDHIKNHYAKNEQLDILKKDYVKSFTISLQELETTDAIIPDVITAAKTYPDYLFILKPRRRKTDYYTGRYALPPNVKVIDDINIYQLIVQTDFHVTVFSTCALEAPALGKMNILFNADEQARNIFGNVLTDQKTTRYVEGAKAFITLIASLDKSDEQAVMAAHENVIFTDYKKNIKQFLEEAL